MKMWVLTDVPEQYVLSTLVELVDDWEQLDNRSIIGGMAERHWRSRAVGVTLLDTAWTEPEAKVFAQQWDKRLVQIEVSDVLVERLGIR